MIDRSLNVRRRKKIFLLRLYRMVSPSLKMTLLLSSLVLLW